MSAVERRFVVGEEHDRGRLDRVVAEVAEISRSAAARWIDAVVCTVDGVPAKRSATVLAGQTVHLPAVAEDPMTGVAPPMPPIRYQDEHVMVVVKPAGMVVHAGAGHRGDTLVDAMLAAGLPLSTGTAPDRPGIVHRLDRQTSGLLMIACSDEAQDSLVEQLRQRTVERRYVAVVRGIPKSPVGVIDAPIARHPTDRQRFACVEGGRPARTHWSTRDSVAGEGFKISLVDCQLETGRTHQIRVHMQAIGHPVLGDDRYGTSVTLDERVSVPRLMLHAGTLGFSHPVTGELVRCQEPVPDDMGELLDRVGLERP